MTILAIIARYLGVTGIVAGFIILFYEGVPLGPVRYIPYVGPALAQFVDGRVDREYARGFAEADAACKAAQRQAELEYLKTVKAKQEELDKLSLEYLQSKADTALRVSALMDTIEAISKEEPDAPASDSSCHPSFIPRRVSNQLDAIK